MREDIKQTLQKLKPLIGKKAEALWYLYQSSDYRERDDVEIKINLIAEKYLKTFQDKIELPPLSKDEAEGDLKLGEISYINKPLFDFKLRKDELLKHIGIFGQTGSGKTVVSLNLLKALCKKKIPFLIFDYKRNYRDIIHHPDFKDEEILIFSVGREVSPFYFNPKVSPPGVEAHVWNKKLCNIIEKAYYLGYGAMDIIMESFNAKTFKEMEEYLKKQRKRARELLWYMSARRSLNSINFPGISEVVNCEQGYPIEKLLQKNVILELDGLSETDKAFLIGSLLLWIYYYRMCEQEREVLKHAIIIEEAHNLFYKTRQGTEDITDIVMREIRELGESITIIDQLPHRISVTALGNIYTKICLSLSLTQDIVAMSNALLLDRDQKRYLGMLKIGEAIVKSGRYSFPFLVAIAEFKLNKGTITDQDLQSHMKRYLKDLRKDMPPPLKVSGIQGIQKRDSLSPIGKILLNDIYINPFTGIVKRYKNLGLGTSEGNNAQNELFALEFIKPKIIDGIKILELTDKGEEKLKGMGIKTDEKRSRGGTIHNFYIHLIKKELIKLGHFTFIEQDKIDLVADNLNQKTAIEVETGYSDLEGNLWKLAKYKADKKFMIATNKETKLTIEGIYAPLLIPDKEKIKIYYVKDFLKNLPSIISC